MAQRYEDEFRRWIVRVARTSGLTQKLVAEDFGIGFSMQGKWFSQYGGQNQSNFDTQFELKRLRKELMIALEERDVLKKAAIFFAGQKS